MPFLPLILSAVSALGFGFVTYEGFDTLITTLVDNVKTNYQGMGSALLSILDMAGFTDALGYSISAITTKSAMTALKRFMPIASK
jgi:hypothetical protein